MPYADALVAYRFPRQRRLAVFAFSDEGAERDLRPCAVRAVGPFDIAEGAHLAVLLVIKKGKIGVSGRKFD